ncbi:uncharacterized protein [Palaemon carinicauda]|uniref:uncharacterized protein n=1 Tax=Palaemon carinicauda TaxID=392227 RepID=UPI0035B6566B
MTELKRLITSRKFVRKSVTESFNQRDQFILLEASDKLALESKLTDNMARLKDLDLQIQGIKWSSEENESELMEELEACENYQDKLRSSLFKLQSPVPTTPSPPTPALPLLKRPTAPLPRYSGQENEDLTKFLSQFEAVINRYEYSDYEKLLLLKQQITGRALVLIDSLESHNQGYSKAKELLEKALASPDVQKFSTIKQLSELNLDKCYDPFEYISKVKGIIENVHSHHKKKVKVTDHSVDMAINVNFTPEGTSGATAKCYPCSLCSTVQEKASHNIRDCTNFISPVSKVEKLKSIDGCTRCGLASHSTEKCRYKFRYRCANCKGFHWNYLCTHPGENQSNDISQKNLDLNKKKFHEKNKDKKDPKAKNPTERSQNNITTITEALNNSSEGDTILPTFTCNKSGSNVRCMKDSRCQSNFISEELASKLNLPVIRESIKLTVNGINVPRSYDTKIVEVEMKFDRDSRIIYALCLPNINITLNLPKLNRVVNGFLSKGYKLADTRLLDGSEDISDIQLILESKSSYCIPETEIVFGEKSIYSRTPHGLVLKGATETILHDLPYLPYAPEVSSSSYISITNRTPDYLPSEEAKFYQNSNIDFGKIEIRNESFVLEGEDDEVSGLVDIEKDVLDSVCDEALCRETSIYSETVEIHTQLVNYVLEKTTRNSEGRLKEHPESSFMPFMGIFKPDRETTKCRVVFLSNLSDKGSMNHNQTMHAGPTLNQKLSTSIINLRKIIDKIQETEAPTKSKLLGLEWDRMSDTLSTKPIQLDINSSTNRQVLSTIASQFDLLNFNGPILNRARLFLHRLQCRPELDWDEKLTAPLINEWKNICKQANSAPSVDFPRNFGARTDKYKLVGFADSSKVLFGAAVYLYNINTNKIYFILARNKLVSKQLESKSIPSLELQALALTVETVKDLKNELSGFGCIDPIEIVGCEVYSDSLVVLTWLQSYALKLDKLQKKQLFILNRVEYINKMCEDSCMRFSFVSGEDNPADCITRPLSFRQLIKTNYITGPKFITESKSNVICSDSTLSFIIPGLFESKRVQKVETNCGSACSPHVGSEHLFPFNRVSSFEKAVRVHAVVLRFCSILKSKFKSKNPALDHFEVEDEGFNFYDEACRPIIIRDQHVHFPDVFDYFHSKQKQLKNLPNIVAQLNLFLDSDGMVRVKRKCRRLKEVQHLNKFNYPLLLSKDSMLVPLIIRELHVKLSHAGCYPLLAELRRNFWITHIYSAVKKVLSNCITCKRLNERVIKLNQSHYPEFRINPENIPYRQIFIDHMGPFKIKNDQGNTVKVWLLCITYLWSRAINLKICMDLTSEEFIRALQLHTYEFGIPSLCLSDLGSQFVAGANQISSFLGDYETNAYLQEHGIKSFKFEHYYNGCNQLGSLVESCVKLTKRLLFGAMRNNILPLRDFDFIVHKTKHLVNRRPISFKESLRDSSGESIPEIITPEMLIHGRELVSINIIPQLQGPTDVDPEFNADQIPSSLLKLQNVRHNLIKIYNEEFVGNLIYQAVNKKDRYKPVQHKELKVGDIVLLKEPLAKPCNYPMGRIKEIVKNVNNEVTAVKVFKGKTGEILKRHSSSIIPLLSVPSDDEKQGIPDTKNVHIVSSRPKRKAAMRGAAKIHQILAESD